MLSLLYHLINENFNADYIVGPKELKCEHYTDSTNALSGTALVEDLNFCSTDIFLSHSNGSLEPEDCALSSMSNVDFSVSTIHLAYDQRIFNDFFSPAEKLELFRSSSHMNCVDIIFRLDYPKREIFKACDCVLKRK